MVCVQRYISQGGRRHSAITRRQLRRGSQQDKRTPFNELIRSEMKLFLLRIRKRPQKLQKTYNSGYSLVVTHLTTNPPVRCLNRAERTGSLVFNVLWSYVKGIEDVIFYIPIRTIGIVVPSCPTSHRPSIILIAQTRA
jgi:hypothetical protein